MADGIGVFFRGLGICSARAFFVNAVQWAVSTPIKPYKGKAEQKKGVRVDDESASSLNLLPNRYYLSKAVLLVGNQD